MWGYSIFSMCIQISWIGKVNVSGIQNRSLTISSRLNNINCTFAQLTTQAAEKSNNT